MNEGLSVEAVGISKVYWDGNRRLEIFKNVSLKIRAGEGVAIWGPSGSGKTTLLNLLSGLDAPNAGEVRLGDARIDRMSETQKAERRNRMIGFVFQFYHLLPEFSALENVLLPAWIRRESESRARERAERLLSQLGLRDRMAHFPSELSGGEQQRVAIARALMNDPGVLFCDEPTGNLDVRRGAEIAELLRGLCRKERKTVVIVTHDERIAKTMDRTIDILKLQEKNEP